MSGIYGVFRFDGAPVEPQILGAMREAMAFYGPDGGGECLEGQVGLGHLLLSITPEDRFEVQPLRYNGLTLATYARLDNREDLLRQFGIPTPEHPTTPDSILVLKAFLRWKEGCHDHLNGDWQFAAWDRSQRIMTVARDHHGNTGLYYYRNSRYFAFASNIKALLSLPDVIPAPDMIRMAQVLTSWPGEASRTSYENIYRLPPAHIMRVSESASDCRRYWYPENAPTLRFAKDEEYVEHFLDIYTQAVRSRLRSARPVGVTLSGGLDSGSVTALAAPLLEAEGKALTAFTSVPLYPVRDAGNDRVGDEWQLAAATARTAGANVLHFPIRSEKAGVLEAIEHQLDTNSGPGHAAGNQFWIRDLLAQARNRGVGVVLTGQCGNATVSFGGEPLSYTLLRRDVRSCMRLLGSAEENHWSTLKRQIFRPLLLPGIRLYRYLRSNGTPWLAYSAINPDFASQLRLADLMREAGHDPTFTRSAPTWQVSVFKPGNSIVGALWHEIGAEYGLEVRDPTSERRIVEFCFRAPIDQFRHSGKARWLIRRAMEGRMPDEVLHGTKRGLQAADLGHRVLAELRGFGEAMRRFESSGLASYCLDLSRMRSILVSLDQTSEMSATAMGQCQSILLRGISVGLFLNRF